MRAAHTKESRCPPQAIGELGASTRQNDLAGTVWPWVPNLVQIPALPLPAWVILSELPPLFEPRLQEGQGFFEGPDAQATRREQGKEVRNPQVNWPLSFSNCKT